MKIKEIKTGDVLILEGRVYRIEQKPISNGEHRGKRPQLVLIKEKELSKMLIDELKGGVKD